MVTDTSLHFVDLYIFKVKARSRSRNRDEREPTSGWNCCSVRVWQYLQASPTSHTVGSIHSSLCFTCGQGVDLERTDVLDESVFPVGFTCIWRSMDCGDDHADCDTGDKHNLVGKAVEDAYTVQSCNWPERSENLKEVIRLIDTFRTAILRWEAS